MYFFEQKAAIIEVSFKDDARELSKCKHVDKKDKQVSKIAEGFSLQIKIKWVHRSS